MTIKLRPLTADEVIFEHFIFKNEGQYPACRAVYYEFSEEAVEFDTKVAGTLATIRERQLQCRAALEVRALNMLNIKIRGFVKRAHLTDILVVED